MKEAARNESQPAHRSEGRRRAVAHPKGRQVDPVALSEIQALLGDLPRRRDLLIEHLHRIQDHYRCLSPAHLTALAFEMKLALAEVYETATFYAHFDVPRDGDPTPPAITVRVCDSITCMLAGSNTLRSELIERLGPAVRVLPAPCVGRCDQAPAVFVGKAHVCQATVESVTEAVRENRTQPILPEHSVGYTDYLKRGGYQLLRVFGG